MKSKDLGDFPSGKWTNLDNGLFEGVIRSPFKRVTSHLHLHPKCNECLTMSCITLTVLCIAQHKQNQPICECILIQLENVTSESHVSV